MAGANFLTIARIWGTFSSVQHRTTGLMRYFDRNTILRTLRYTETYRTSSHASTLFSCDIARSPAPVPDIEPRTAEPPVDTRSRVRVILPALRVTPTDKKFSLKAATRDNLEYEYDDEHQHPKPGTYDEHKDSRSHSPPRIKDRKNPRTAPQPSGMKMHCRTSQGLVISGIFRLHEITPSGIPVIFSEFTGSERVKGGGGENCPT